MSLDVPRYVPVPVSVEVEVVGGWWGGWVVTGETEVPLSLTTVRCGLSRGEEGPEDPAAQLSNSLYSEF